MINKIIVGVALLAASFVLAEIPGSSFAIVIDQYHGNELKTELQAYKNALEKEGLNVFILQENWKQPEQIRNQLQQLYTNNKLEGAIFVGNIPVPMIRDAQHLTSTFKMPQDLDWTESSVPSDRYYDDFDLQFNFIKQDENKKNLYYYQLDAKSPQFIQMDIYSGRLKPPTSNPEESVAYIRKYLEKVIAQKSEKNPLDNITTYTAEGYNSNALNSWSSVLFGFRNQFKGLFQSPNQIKFSSYNNKNFMKPYWMTQLARQEVDYAYFNGHGLPDYQIVSGNPEGSAPSISMENVSRYIRAQMRKAKEGNKDLTERKAYFQNQLGLNDKWFENIFEEEIIRKDSIYEENLTISLNDLKNWKVNAKLVYLDACLNGSFQLDEYIAGYYPFSEGNNIATFANSVGVLQDLWANEMMGLIQNGTRIGQILKHSAYLETHIFGDPTFSFTAENQNQWNNDIAHNTNEKYWKNLANHSIADVQALALRKLAEYHLKPSTLDLITNKFYQSNDEVVRTEAYLILKRIKPSNWNKILIAASKDNYEYLRRISIYDMSEIGSDEFIQPLIAMYFNDRMSNRTTFNVERMLDFFEKERVVKAFDLEIQNHPVFDKEIIPSVREKLAKGSFITKYFDQLREGTLPEKDVKFTFSILRAYRLHSYIPDIIRYLEEHQSNEKLTSNTIEALSWFKDSHHKPLIKAYCLQIIADNQSSADVKYQAERTLSILK